LAPAVGFEPTTNRLTADRSTTELRWIFFLAVAERESCPCDMRRQVRIGYPTEIENLVAGAGFEPAVRQLPDYELRGCKPVIA
jgi:hypothetical protein